MGNTSGIEKSPSVVIRFLRVIVVLAVAIALAKLLIFLRQDPEKKEIVKAPPSVKVIVVNPVSKVMHVDSLGTVTPRKLVKVAVEVPGRIDYIHPSFVEGGLVDSGDLLIRIDQRSYDLDRQAGKVRIEQAETDIASLKQDIENLKNDVKLSKANMDLAGKELERVTVLMKNQFASRNSLDKVSQQYLQAKIQLQAITNRLVLTDTLMEQKKAMLSMARVDFQKAELALKKTEIRSEFKGYVLEKFAESGEYVNPGQVIGSIYEKDRLDVNVSIPLEKMKWIEAFFKDGQTPRATVTMANFDGAPETVWKARVARVKAKIDEKTRTLPMTLEIVTPDEEIHAVYDLKPGTFVRCRIVGETVENIFVLPRYLLKNDTVLYALNGTHLEMKNVTILRKFEDEVFISAGLSPGDRIISSPLPGAREGMELKIKENGK